MKTFKAQLRIPTEMYAYIEVEVEGTAEQIVEAYYEFTKLVKPQEGLPTKEWQAALDRYLNDGSGETEVYMAMSPTQKAVMQELKKAFNRIDYKANKK